MFLNEQLKKILYILIIFVFGIGFAQEKEASDCNLQTENELWKADYEKSESQVQRIELIKQKIIADSVYIQFEPKIITTHSATIINKFVDANGNDCGCKILFILYYKKRKAIVLDLQLRPELNVIVEKLNSENIADIFHSFEKETARAIYGAESGKCGFVQMTVKERKLKKLIKNVWHHRI